MAESASSTPLVAGVDGCRGGWVAIFFPLGLPGRASMVKVESFAGLLTPALGLQFLAVDMPIGLPDHVGPEGRGPEQAVRKLLGPRQSSVFTVPSRAAVYCEEYRQACEVALQTSEPAKKVSKQCFYLFPKIREIDGLMSSGLESRVYEVHPEVALWRLNGCEPMSLPKKVKSSPNGPGLDQRQSLLEQYGFERAFLEQQRPPGVGRDDFLDAAANSLIAQRIARGEAEPFPADYRADGKGLRMAIWA